MTPAFTIFANRQDISAIVHDRLVSLSVSDRAGSRSDTAELRLDDRDGTLELPPKGAELEISLGYEETGLVKMGLFTVDEIELSGPPDIMIIRAKAADMRKSLKEHKTRAWENITLEDLVGTIAAEHQLQPSIEATLGAVIIPHLDQTEESDLHLLTRLARQYDAVAKPASGFLLFVPKGQAKTATGRTIPAVAISRNQASSYRVTLADRGKYQAVQAYWHDTADGIRKSVQVGNGEPVFSLRHNYPDAERATAAATAKLDALNRGVATASLTFDEGNPALAAEARLTLSAFRKGLNGDWIATEVSHNLSDDGFSTRADAEVPKA